MTTTAAFGGVSRSSVTGSRIGSLVIFILSGAARTLADGWASPVWPNRAGSGAAWSSRSYPVRLTSAEATARRDSPAPPTGGGVGAGHVLAHRHSVGGSP